jgi:hypothetical protein
MIDRIGRESRRAAGGFLLLALVGAAGCDLSVTNPGPVNDEFLSDPKALGAVVGGMIRATAESQNWLMFDGAVVSREVTASGGTGAHGYSPRIALGFLDSNERGGAWSRAHRARFVSEDGTRRIREALGAEAFGKSALAAEGLVWAGFANRALGENMCNAVIDGGTSEPSRVHFARADSQFTEAMAVARAANRTDLERAAIAGRASVRGWLGNWAAAAVDAALVPADFSFAVRRSIESPDVTTNMFGRANQNAPWRSHSESGTWYEDYYTAMKDPRTPWASDPAFPRGDGRPVPWLYEMKYGGKGAGLISPVRLASGAEARLIIAESRLRAGDIPGTLAIINQLRTAAGVPVRTATTTAEAWTALKLERFIVLWLEARLLWDHRRYSLESTPGPLPDRLNMAGRSLCFPISDAEANTNPNIPDVG